MECDKEIQIWGGIECTVNRVGNRYFDQFEYSGHYKRGAADLDLIASLGIKMLRYPVLWEKHLPWHDSNPDWSFAEQSLSHLQKLGITPIVGLVHHGSGPRYVNFFDGSFENGLAEYAKKVAEKFPWLEYFTAVNEPLTTARFCGLYGHWYPHGQTDKSFYKILLSECKATVLAMRAIREVIPGAKLIQTEDLGKCHSTELLQYQADLENERRWLSYDLLCGTLIPNKVMYQKMLAAGITKKELNWFLHNNCKPHIAGFNYYLTSERFLDEEMHKYPEEFHGGNHRHRYADIHTVHVPMQGRATGPEVLLREAWERLRIPLAITECHLHSTREDQMRWFYRMWKAVNKIKAEGVDFRAITAWAIFGLTGWNKLVTQPGGDYEPGVFNVSSGHPRPTALAQFLQDLTQHKTCDHPVLENEGWWERSNRLLYGDRKVLQMGTRKRKPTCRSLIILGKTGTLGSAFSKVCDERNIHHLLFGRQDLDLTNTASMEQVLKDLNPWGVINAAGYVNVDEAERDEEVCAKVNAEGPAALAAACNKYGIRFLSFSSDLVFNGYKGKPYIESDIPDPLNAYGRSKALAEQNILKNDPHALVVRTSSFFGPWDEYNFVSIALDHFRQGKEFEAADNVHMSPTYVPDLVHTSLDLLLDGEEGIVHIANSGTISWADLARQVALLAGYDERLVKGVSVRSMSLKAKRPWFSALESERGIILPSFENALERYLDAKGESYRASRIAI